MTLVVDIADRQYDYTDEEKAAEAVAEFQAETGLSDEAVIALWASESSSERNELEARIFNAVDANGSTKRAQQTIPGGVSLFMESDTA